MPLAVLVANRGEIARRVFRTARRMGLRTIAVYSDADAREPFVREADAAVRLGPAPARESYLAIDRVVAAARDARADLVHPGYGFLAEEPAFAEAVAAAGLTFVGPPAPVLRLLGSKAEARRSAVRADVPVVPGYDGAEQTDGALRGAARRVGYPLLVKPSAGGGGKGMVLVRGEGDLADALASSRRVAAAAFGDDALILERYVPAARHVEVQFVADARGAVAVLGERDCSAQRRHQKIVEESPAPHLAEGTRAALHAAAARLAREVGYVNAGTAEFILDAGGAFFFIEVNARLQVEHPVTELVSGLDLVELQLRLARGEPAPQVPRPSGHAIEARVYAEDPAVDFAPSTGAALHCRWPAGVRVDAGIEEGSAITPYYDPLLAKIVTRGEDRASALRALAAAIDETEILGVRTNLPFLRALLAHRAMRAGTVTTDLIERELPRLVRPHRPATEALALAAGAAYSRSGGLAARRDAWAAGGAWRLFDEGGSTIAVRDGDAERSVRVSGAGPYRAGEHLLRRDPAEPHSWTVDDRPAAAALDGGRVWTAVGGHVDVLEVGPRERALDAAAAGDLAAPLPGVIVAVRVRAGSRVSRGDVLIVVEAMKMELPVRAPADGVVREVRVAVGDLVDRGEPLVELETPK